MTRRAALKLFVPSGAALLALAATAFLLRRSPRPGIPQNESNAIAALRAYLGAQYRHWKATGAYARELRALVGHGLEPEMAAAQYGSPGARPFRGYYFSDVLPKLLLFAFPAEYGLTGRNTFLTDECGTCYQRDLGGAMPPMAKPGTAPEPKVAAANVPEDDSDVLRKGNMAFALDLYQVLSREADGGFLFSPHGISTAMAMCRAGAKGETAEQIAEALHFTLPPERLHPAFQSVVHDLARSVGSEGCELSIASCLWGDRQCRVRPEFRGVVREHYGSEMRQADFAGDRAGAAREINSWVVRETRGRIPGCIEARGIPDAALLLCINAVYFRGRWQSQFQEWDTKDEPFELADGEKVDVPLMRQTAAFGYAETDELQILQMPYAGSTLAMVVLLPSKASSIGDLEARLTPENLEAWLDALSSTVVLVCMPRFSIDSRFDVIPTLRAMGIEDAFIPGRCDLSGIGEGVERVARVAHRALVEVDEEGTVAVAISNWIPIGAGDGGDEESPPPPVFRADRPFLFLILETRTRSIVFLGRVMDPREDRAAGPF